MCVASGGVGPAMALQAGAGLLEYHQKKEQASALNKHYQKVQDRNNEIANQSALANYEQLLVRREQERAASVQSMLSVTRESAQVAGATTAAAAENGGGVGQSFSLLLDDFERQELEAITSEQRNQQYIDQQTNESLESVRRDLENARLSNVAPKIQKPSYLNAVLGIGAQTASTYYAANKS